MLPTWYPGLAIGYNNNIKSTPIPIIVPYSTPSTSDNKNVVHNGSKSISETKKKYNTLVTHSKILK